MDLTITKLNLGNFFLLLLKNLSIVNGPQILLE